ncbi:uncharacterized protein LOC107272915 isoform X1 [Cephus cinctus]|uniref:Uncharacterized protein LOC107272915 isoform X1 n=1 Tax=Cephus cinctus TaxID=211228 RepID=A0AAJ7CBP9_CEPCN|nr:uncharacterized protein LOC107272915 isoform X1 [Cephus cinctus]
MNIDSYCKEGKNGNFCILFRNTSALSVDQIHKIFSEFGNVLSVNCAGNERGMRFVSYKSKIEAINSIMSLKGHESINLTPWMNKEEKDLKSQNKYKGQQSRLTRVDDHELNFKQSKSDGTISSTNSNSMLCDETESTGERSNGSNNSDNFIQSKNNKSISNSLPRSTHKDIQSENQGKEGIEIEKCGNNNRIKSIHKIANCLSYQGTTDKEQLIKESGATKDNLHGSAGNRNSMMESEKLNDDIPDLITSKEVMQNVNDYNAYSNNYASTLKKIKIVQAGEVIVANISKPFGAAYILHLFESYQPICISSIMTTTQSIRYCHVYFQTPLEAHKVEKKFDKFPLHDNNLIVLRPEKLASEIQLL